MKKIVIMVMVMFMSMGFGISFANPTSACGGKNCNQVQVQGQQQKQKMQQKQRMQQGQIAAGGAGGAGGSVAIKDSMNSDASAGFELKDSFNQIPLREFPVPGQVVFPMTPGYFGPSTPGQNFIPLNILMMYNTEWSKDSIDTMVSDNSGWGDGLNLQIRRIAKPENSENENEDIKVYTSTTKPKTKNVKQIAFAVVACDDDEHISVDNFAKLMQECYKMGGNVVQFTSEGINRKMRASGWGVGFNNSVAVMSSGQGLGNMAVGGMGYTNGTSGYVDRPWLQAVFLKVDSDNIQFEPKPQPKKMPSKEISEIEKRLNAIEARENSGTFVKSTTIQ